MNLLVLFSALLVLATKACDCLSTLRAVRTPFAETNLIARRGMVQFGVRPVVAFAFVLACVWTGLLAAVAMWTESLTGKVAFVLIAGFVAAVQAAVAMTNWTGRWNPVTRVVLRYHRVLGRLLPWRRRHVAAPNPAMRPVDVDS